MIRIKNLCKSFDGFTAVNDLSFDVNPGEVLGFLGPNGAGKSTTMKMISGFIHPDSGSVEVFEYNTAAHPLEVKRQIGYLPEGAPAWGEMTTREFLEFIADIRGLTGNEKSNRIDAVVTRLELESVLHRPIDNLSKGFKRRVGIAQAIVHDPRVLILDEPTDGLDPNQKHQVRELIRNLARDKIVIVSTHILEEVNAVCSRAVVIANGKLVADNTPSELERRSRFHNAITVELTDDVDFQRIVSGLPGVASVEQDTSSPLLYTVFPENNENLYTTVNTIARDNEWPVVSLNVERGRLDDVFRDITRDQLDRTSEGAQ